MPFEEGQSGNPAGRPKSAKLFKDALTLAIKRTEGDKTMLAHIADSLVAKALLGDVPAIKEVADRLDGKATQPIGGDPDNPITFERIVREIVDPRNPDPTGS
jgi:hypothetical protein